MEDDICSLMVDVGSGMMKAGYTGDDAPRAVFPTILGDYCYPVWQIGGYSMKMVGDIAQARRGILNLLRPVQNGIVVDWDGLEAIFHHTFYLELAVSPEEHPILVSTHSLVPSVQHERYAQMMFEHFDAAAFYIAPQATLAAYGSGRSSAIVLNTGEGGSQVQPVYEGYTFPGSIQGNSLGGAVLTEFLFDELIKQDVEKRNQGKPNLGFAGRTSEIEIARDVKEKLGYVTTVGLKEEASRVEEQSIPMPGENLLSVKELRYLVPEILFDPTLVGSKADGVHTMVTKCIDACPIDTRRDFYGKIVVAGGPSMFPGFSDRLRNEIQAWIPEGFTCDVYAPPERKYLVWIGGSIFGNHLRDWVSKDKYEEIGPTIMRRNLHL